jgi:hypothetical protein
LRLFTKSLAFLGDHRPGGWIRFSTQAGVQRSALVQREMRSKAVNGREL